MSTPTRYLVPTLLLSCLGGALSAVDMVRNDPLHPRLVAEVMLGTAGFEAGIAAEWRISDEHLLLRPEVLINEDGRPAIGGSIGWNLTFLDLPERHALTIGPRVIYHNSDEYGWGADAMAIWHFDLVNSPRGRHYLEVIGTAGVIEDDENEETDFAAGGGIGYGFQF